MRTPGVKKALTTTNEKLRRSSQVKTQVTRYAYNDYMVHHYAFAMKVAAEQEPERPSLRHRLEGENRPNRRKEIREESRRRNKAMKNHAQSREEPRNQAAQQSHARKPRRAALQAAKSREEKPRRKDASRSTDFATTHNTSWNTDSAMSIRIDASRSGPRIPSETDPT